MTHPAFGRGRLYRAIIFTLSLAAKKVLAAACLPARFFDLKSGEAGEILQKLRTYRIRMALVGGLAEAAASQRFTEMMIEENRQRWFHMFAAVDAAVDWLAGSPSNH